MSAMTDDAAGFDPAAGLVPSEAKIARKEMLRQLVRSKTFIVGMLIILFWIFWAITGSTFTPHDPLEQTANILKAPNSTYWFGTDQFGRDIFSRVLAGAQSTLRVAPAATVVAITLGTILGLIMGFVGGFTDDALSRIVDAVLALPLIVIAVVVLTALGSSNITLILVIGLIFTSPIARTVRATVLGERQLDYVQAAQLRGERGPYIMFVEILPNIMGPIIVETTVRLGYAIFAIAGLTFLGFGVQPPSPDWSLQISENYTLLSAGTYWWTVVFACLAITTLVIAVNLVADGLQQVVDE